MSSEPPANKFEKTTGQVQKLVGDIGASGLRPAFERVLESGIPVGILQVACQNRAGAIFISNGSIKAAIAPASRLLGLTALKQILSADEGKYRFTTELPREPIRETLAIDLDSLLSWRHPAQPETTPSLMRALDTLSTGNPYSSWGASGEAAHPHTCEQYSQVETPTPGAASLLVEASSTALPAPTSTNDHSGLQEALARFEEQRRREPESEPTVSPSTAEQPLPMNRSTDQRRRKSMEHRMAVLYRIAGGHLVTDGQSVTGPQSQPTAGQDQEAGSLHMRPPHEITLPTGKTLKASGSSRFRHTLLSVGVASGLLLAAVIATNKILTENNAIQGLQRGKQLLKDGYKDLAQKSFTRVIEHDPGNVPALLGRAAASLQLHDFPAARVDYDKVLELDPDNVEAMNGKAEIFVQMKDYQQAITTTENAVKSNPDNVRALLIQSQAYLAMGQNEQAAIAATRIIEKKAPDVLAAAYAARGDAFLALNNASNAYSDFSQALLVDPSNRANYGKRAQAEYERREYNAAIADTTQALFADQTNPALFLLRAQAFEKTGQLEKAVQDLDKAVELKPAIDTYAERARVHAAMKNYNHAYADLCEICKDPRAPAWYRAQLTEVEAKVKNVPVTKIDVESLAGKPEVAHVLKYDEMVREGYARLNAGDAMGAIQMLSLVVNLNPADVEARRYLARAYTKIGQSQMAIDQFQYVQAAKPLDGHDTCSYAQALFDLQEYNQASPLLNSLLLREPDNAEARILLVECLLRMNDKLSAMEMCRAGASRARTLQDLARFQHLYQVAQTWQGQ